MSESKNLSGPQFVNVSNKSSMTFHSRKTISRKCVDGILTTHLDYIKYDSGKVETTLCLRYVRAHDQKAYVVQLDNETLDRHSPLRADPKIVKAYLAVIDVVVPLEREYVIVFRHFSESATFVLKEEVDSISEQIAQLKREHAAELAALREQITAIEPMSPFTYYDCDEPSVKKIKT